MTITCKYSCHLCGLKSVTADVPARGEEDVIAWMEQTIRVLADDHRRRSPFCHPKELNDVMIPISGAQKIGGPSVN